MKEFAPKSNRNKLIALGAIGGAALALGANLPIPSGAKADSVEIACSGSQKVTAGPGDTLIDIIRESSVNTKTNERLTGEQAFLATYAIDGYLKSDETMPDNFTVSSFDTPAHNSIGLTRIDVGQNVIVPKDCRVINTGN